MAKVISDAIKTDGVATGAAIVTAYAAQVLAAKHGLPLEIASAAIGLVVTGGYKLVKWVKRIAERRAGSR